MTRLLPPLAAALLALGCPALADGDPGTGALLFRDNCAACHGAAGMGDGPMTEILTIAPADLTALAAGGDFPAADLVRLIDGRAMIPAHGGPMPLFGAILEGDSAVIDAPDGTPVFTTQPVLDIVAWLATIQR